jgi:hypothetical protein
VCHAIHDTTVRGQLRYDSRVNRFVVATLACAALACPTEVRADGLEGDLAAGALVPLAGERYREAVGFGGRLAARAYVGHLAGQLELAGFASPGSNVETLTYRGRAMAGMRWRNKLDSARGMAIRGLGGVEYGGFSSGSTSGRGVEAHHLGFAVEGAIESHTQLFWADVSIGVALVLTVQPFGETDGADYIGLEGVLQLGFGFSTLEY